MYSGEGDSTTQPQQNGSGIEQSVNPDPQPVNYDYLADTLSPEELSEFMHLSAENRTLVAALVESGERAGKVGATIRELLAKAQDNGNNFSADIEPVVNGKVISVNLPVFLTRHMHDPAKYLVLCKALREVFEAYYRTDEYRGTDFSLNKHMAYHALEISLEKVIEWGAKQVLDVLPDKAVVVPGDIEENPYQPQAYEVLMLNPANFSGVEQLQKWVGQLQGMLINLNSTVAGQEKIIKRYEQIEANQEEIIEKFTTKDKLQEQLLAEMERLSNSVRVKTSSGTVITQRAESTSVIKLSLGLNGIDILSEVDSVKAALEGFRNESLESAMKHIRDGNMEDAFNRYEDFGTMQRILDEISNLLSDAAEKNRLATEYAKSPVNYAEYYRANQQLRVRDFDEFTKKFSTNYTDEGDQPEADPVSPDAITEQPSIS